MKVILLNPEAIKHAVSEIIETAGRICYDSKKKGAPENFIARIIASGHESVVEHGAASFLVSGISRACSHQYVRHRLASYSQRSQRYVLEDNASFVTPESIEKAGHKNGYNIHAFYREFLQRAAGVYKILVDAGIPKEDARYVLPNACCTEMIITMNFRELRHFLKLRTSTKAQWEIREVANRILGTMRAIAPVLVEDIE